jgi:sugar O-acyltransferase (sialic acid O-acetyltransferase NeuD family)
MPEQTIIIVGAGGFGREVLQYVLDSIDPATYRVKGFLDDYKESLQPASLGFSVLGTTAGYSMTDHDRFVLAIGEPQQRRVIAQRLTRRGAQFLTVVHPLAHVAKTARLGAGCILAPFAAAGACAELGDHVALTFYASIGHDARVGNCCALSPYSVSNGGTILEECVFLGTHAVVNPLKRVGSGSRIAAGAVVYRDVPANSLAAGNPAKILPILQADPALYDTAPK